VTHGTTRRKDRASVREVQPKKNDTGAMDSEGNAKDSACATPTRLGPPTKIAKSTATPPRRASTRRNCRYPRICPQNGISTILNDRSLTGNVLRASLRLSHSKARARQDAGAYEAPHDVSPLRGLGGEGTVSVVESHGVNGSASGSAAITGSQGFARSTGISVKPA